MPHHIDTSDRSIDGGVWTGVDVLAEDGCAALRGQTVGLVTNHTGLTRGGQSTIDVLHAAPGVALAALFGPEHGLRGEHDEAVADGVDAQTGLPAYSLFGARTRPTATQMDGLDTLVFDIQDIGCRFYTYLSTLLGILEAASEAGLKAVVLDRPNPLGGTKTEGPCADADALSFVACHPVPLRHGLTLGEMARLLWAERGLTCPLTIIPCRGWRRGDWYDDSGLLWTNPSPNMRRLSAAVLYPGVGLLEFTNVSVGRGTDTPFEVFGAPYLTQPRAFAQALHAHFLPGVRFVPVFFTPTASVFAGERCGGVQIWVTDRDALDAVAVGLALAVTLRDLTGNWQPEKLQTLLVNQRAYDALLSGKSADEIAGGWADDLRAWAGRVAPHRLYEA